MCPPNLPRAYRLTFTHIDDPHQCPSPKLESLTLSDLNIFFSREQKLLDLLEERHGLKMVGVQSCRVHDFEDELRELVEEVEWDNVIVEGPGSDQSSDADSDDEWLGNRARIRTFDDFELPFNPDDMDVGEEYHLYLAE